MNKRERAAKLYEEGMTLKAIGNRFHKSHICIRNWCLKCGVKMRRRGRPVAA